jgi:hypothetical protein
MTAIEIRFENTEARNPARWSRFHGLSSKHFDAIILP